VHLKEKRGVPSHDRGISSTSEVATVQLEFKYLSYLTGDDKYWKAAENVVLKINELDTLDGLVPIYINPYTGQFQGGEIRLGSRGDSYYGKFLLLPLNLFFVNLNDSWLVTHAHSIYFYCHRVPDQAVSADIQAGRHLQDNV
jgi:hypothetical protein